MDLVKFEQLNSRGFELRIEVVLVPTTDNEKVCSRILPKSFLVDLGVDPRTVLKQLLVKSVGASICSVLMIGAGTMIWGLCSIIEA